MLNVDWLRTSSGTKNRAIDPQYKLLSYDSNNHLIVGNKGDHIVNTEIEPLIIEFDGSGDDEFLDDHCGVSD